MSERTRPAPVREAVPLPRHAPARRLGSAEVGAERAAPNGAAPTARQGVPSVIRAASRRTRTIAALAGLSIAAVAVGAAVGWVTRPAPMVTATVLTSDATTEAPRLTVDGTTYAVGQPGDIVVLGDFDGDERPSAALLRPATGAVYVFDEWPEPGSAVTPRALEVPSGLASVEVVPDLNGDALLGRYTDGRTVALNAGTAGLGTGGGR
jgi:hypothetical protein